MALIDRFSGDLDERRMSLGEHLEELRKHVWKSMIWIVGALVICLCFQERLTAIARRPFDLCMKKIADDERSETARKKLGRTALVSAALDEDQGNADLQARQRKIETKAALLKTKINEHPEALVAAFAKRRGDLEKRQQEIEKEEDELLDKPDGAKIAALEAKRAVLATDAKAYSDELERDVIPLLDAADASIHRKKLVSISFPETFMGYLKVAIVFAIFIASPLIARELWKFVSAGLYKHEKRYVTLFAPATFIVFTIGCCFGYFILIPAALEFLATYGGDEIGTEFRLSDYLSLVLNLTLMIGLVFELPLVMGFVSLLGFTTPDMYKKFRRYWLLVAFILGAVIAPSPDPFNQSLCAVPLILLYEIGILLSRWITRNQPRDAEPLPLPDGTTVAPMPSGPVSQPGAPTRS
ncbi:MAG TPA: twin-arginine translocase subunit TatC [Planctomycetota bacterium]|nr:twin-arginine translocase subunit TatC [Planctomycetota bacterium]